MKKRTLVSPLDLHLLLEREFRRRKSRECDSCYLQLPYRVDGVAVHGSNWEVPLPLHCAAACRLHAEEVVSELASLYDLEPAAQ